MVLQLFGIMHCYTQIFLSCLRMHIWNMLGLGKPVLLRSTFNIISFNISPSLPWLCAPITSNCTLAHRIKTGYHFSLCVSSYLFIFYTLQWHKYCKTQMLQTLCCYEFWQISVKYFKAFFPGPWLLFPKLDDLRFYWPFWMLSFSFFSSYFNRKYPLLPNNLSFLWVLSSRTGTFATWLDQSKNCWTRLPAHQFFSLGNTYQMFISLKFFSWLNFTVHREPVLTTSLKLGLFVLQSTVTLTEILL